MTDDKTNKKKTTKITLPNSIVELDIEDSLLEEIDKARGSKSREEWLLEAIEVYTDMLSI